DSGLFYSLDGSEPSIPYAGPIAISDSTAVRAVARRAGFHSPQVVTHTYLFKNSVMTSPLMSATYTQGPLATRLRNSLTQIPTICLSVPAIPDDRQEREASVEILIPDGTPPFQVNGGVVRYGGAWTDFAKKSYRLRFRDRYGDNRLRHPIFRGFDRGMPVREDIRTLNLNAGNHDMVDRGFYMSQRFVEDSMLDMGSLNPHGRFVHVYFNGVYWGQYHAQERLEDAMLASYLGGNRDDYVNVLGNDNVGDEFVPGTPEPPDREAWETARANRSNFDFVKGYVDLPHLTDTMLLWTYGNCESEFRCAGPVAAPGSGFKFWLADADGFLRTSGDRTDRLGPGGIFGALRAAGHPDFKIMVADRIHKHFFNNGALTPARNLARLNARMAEIQDSMIAECARWGYRTPDNWLSAADNVRTNIFPTRSATVVGYWRSRGLYPTVDAPAFSQFGGSVPRGYPLVMSAAAGTVYYRTDGGDPRLPGGGIAPEAQLATTATVPLISAGAVWKYWDGAAYPAANWRTPAYSDAAWKTGPAPLGYGGGQTTTIGFGPNSSSKYITACFRKAFSVANPAAITGLTINLARDDGAVVYLNGVEVARSNMPAGTIAFTTAASAVVSGDTKYAFQVIPITPPPGLLLAAPAENLIAVEVHQQNATSSDLYLNLTLTATTTTVVTLNDNTTVKARALHNGVWSALADPSFQIAHPLVAAGPYQLTNWSADSPAGSYPNAMRFHQTDLPDPALAVPMDAAWTLPYSLTSRSRINGLGDNGVSFVNTGNVQDLPGAGYVGAAVLNLDTTGAEGVRVLWTGGTVAPNDRDYGIRLQYRVGDSGGFTDVTHQGQPVEYLRNPTAGHSAMIGPVTLPADADNRPLVQLRWKYYYRSGNSGARAQLRLDDILVTAGVLPPAQIAFETAPASAQSGALLAPVVVRLTDANGLPALGFDGPVTLTLDGPGGLSGTLTVNASDGTAVFGDLVLTGTGEHRLTATAGELAAITAPFRTLALTPLLVPQFIQGGADEAGDNNNRVPFAWRARIDGLVPHATYRFANRVVTTADPPASDGAGNMTFVTGHATGWLRGTASPGFLAGDLGTGHFTFTAGADGAFTGWFVTEPTGNTRFTPGNLLHPRLILNDGNGGENAFHHLTCDLSAQVINFGSGPNDGSAVVGASFAPPRSFAAIFANPAGSDRPMAVTPVESTGAALDDRYAAFYLTDVAAPGGRWGAILPNTLPTGLRRIAFLGASNATTLYQITADAALTGSVADQPATTANPVNGLTPLILDTPAEPTAYEQWRARHFPDPADFANPAVSGPAATPAGDAVANLMRYAFGLGPSQPVAGRLPFLAPTPGGGFAFRFPYSPGKSDLIWRVLASPDLTDWSGVVFDSATDPSPPVQDGWAEIPIPEDHSPRTFRRLMVELR
ncbi:MAG: CotH kinase family protein, partial [Akkermansiaceae bacterium]|nr:CotH kinase family protein [Akkermansiaceae bacterium]